MIDRDLPENIWNLYLKSCKNRFRCLRDELGLWSIKCKNGYIQPYSIEKKQLMAVLDFKTKRQLTWFKKKLQYKTTISTTISQEGDTDICIVFNEYDLKKLGVVFRVFKKKNYLLRPKLNLGKTWSWHENTEKVGWNNDTHR